VAIDALAATDEATTAAAKRLSTARRTNGRVRGADRRAITSRRLNTASP
jgi:hypothetical protein